MYHKALFSMGKVSGIPGALCRYNNNYVSTHGIDGSHLRKEEHAEVLACHTHEGSVVA